MQFKIFIRTLFIGLIFFIFFSYAQMFPSNKGFAVNFSGDTLKGEIIIQNSYRIKFKSIGEKEYVILNPNEINVVSKGKDIYYHSEELPLLGNMLRIHPRTYFGRCSIL